MGTIITIQQIEDAVSKAGKAYWKVATEQGAMSCFEDKVIENLKKYPNSRVDVDVATSGDKQQFKNIRAFNNVVPEMTAQTLEIAPVVEVVKMTDKFTEARDSKNVSIFTSYAKDLFVALLLQDNGENETQMDDLALMAHSIALVKLARDSFS